MTIKTLHFLFFRHPITFTFTCHFCCHSWKFQILFLFSEFWKIHSYENFCFNICIWKTCSCWTVYKLLLWQTRFCYILCVGVYIRCHIYRQIIDIFVDKLSTYLSTPKFVDIFVDKKNVDNSKFVDMSIRQNFLCRQIYLSTNR